MVEEMTKTLDMAHKRLRKAAEMAAVELSKDVFVMSSIEGVELDKVERYLFRGSWVQLVPGIRIMLIDDYPDCTKAILEGNGGLPSHYHTYRETLFVVDGTVVEETTGKVYYAGMTVEHPIGFVHKPRIQGTVIVTWRPPLPQYTGELSALDPLVLHLT